MDNLIVKLKNIKHTKIHNFEISDFEHGDLPENIHIKTISIESMDDDIKYDIEDDDEPQNLHYELKHALKT
jgi:hypothetical protein